MNFKTIKMKKVIGLFFVLGLFSLPAFAQDDAEFDEAVKTMFKAVGFEENYKVVIKQMMEMYKNDGQGDPAIWDELEAEFMKSSIDELTELLIPVYKKYYTLDDLKQIIAFYETPVGKKLQASTPLITQESMAIGQEWGKGIAVKLMERIKNSDKK